MIKCEITVISQKSIEERKYRGAAHNSCNLLLCFGNVIPVVFHNLRGYDSHLIMQAISQVEGEIIPFSLIKKKKLEEAQACLGMHYS